tara:strand:- start:1142 stop:1543 length:402 start_codon:yes stop_codon:yes gene_type:complete
MPDEYLKSKGQGRGYKQKPFSGFGAFTKKSAFNSNGDYDPQTVTRRNPNTDITPQSEPPKYFTKAHKIERHEKVITKPKKKSKLGNILLGALGGAMGAGAAGGIVGAIKGAGGIKNLFKGFKNKNQGGKVWKA